MIEGTVRSEKGFYVGDICYAMNPNLYHKYWIDTLGCAEGVHFVPVHSLLAGNAGFSFAVGYTAWGDGCYSDNHFRAYAVDAANIGVLPLELVDFNREPDAGHVFYSPGVCTFECCDGVFYIDIPGIAPIKIDTN